MGSTAPRLHLARTLRTGEVLVLPASSSRHVQVLRLQPGAAVTLFNGDDGLEWRAEITRVGRAEVELRVGESSRPARELRLAVTLAIGVPANERMDALVEKASELGAATIQPLVCERSVLRLADERAAARRRHWQGIAAAASEQCGRVRVAHVAALLSVKTWLGGLDDLPAARAASCSRLLLSLDEDALTPTALPAAAFAAGAALTVLSGPEGGLSPDEESAAVERGFVRVGLGPRILRADTAPLALLAWLGLGPLAHHP